MQSEESNMLVKLANAVIEHAPEGATAFQDIKFSDIEAALSTDAGPVKTAPAVAVEAIEAVWKYSLVIESSVRRGDGPDQYAGVTEALRLVKEARSALSAQVQDVAGWQPIETAPKDGSSVLGFWSYTYLGDKEPTTGIEIIEWHDGKFHGWKDRDGVTQDGVYTHWMLLPEAPAAPAKQEGCHD